MKPPQYLETLVLKLTRLPGIGPKSASRLAFHLLGMQAEEVESLARAMIDLKRHIRACAVCGGIAEADICSICADDSRDHGQICVVESAKDIITIEATGAHHGVYHVLGGLISPLDGIGPDDLAVSSLVAKCSDAVVGEVILALNPSVEGDATAMYIARLLRPFSITVSRIAHGLPVGADLEFADTATIIKSIEGRVKL